MRSDNYVNIATSHAGNSSQGCYQERALGLCNPITVHVNSKPFQLAEVHPKNIASWKLNSRAMGSSRASSLTSSRTLGSGGRLSTSNAPKILFLAIPHRGYLVSSEGRLTLWHPITPGLHLIGEFLIVQVVKHQSCSAGVDFQYGTVNANSRAQRIDYRFFQVLHQFSTGSIFRTNTLPASSEYSCPVLYSGASCRALDISINMLHLLGAGCHCEEKSDWSLEVKSQLKSSPQSWFLSILQTNIEISKHIVCRSKARHCHTALTNIQNLARSVGLGIARSNIRV